MATGFAPIEVPGYRFLEQTLAGCWEASRRIPRARSAPRRAPRGGLGAPPARTSNSANGPKARMPAKRESSHRSVGTRYSAIRNYFQAGLGDERRVVDGT